MFTKFSTFPHFAAMAYLDETRPELAGAFLSFADANETANELVDEVTRETGVSVEDASMGIRMFLVAE